LLETFQHTRTFLRKVKTAIGILCLFSIFLCETAAADLNKEIIFGAIGNFPPYYQLDKNGKTFGFSIDTTKAIARRLGLKIKFKVFKSGRLMHKALREGEIDALPSLGITESRKKIYDFTAPIETFQIVYFIRSDSHEIKTMDDIHQRKIGVTRTNAANRILARRKNVKRKVFADAPSALFGLLSAQVDVVAYPKPVFQKLARDGGITDRFKIVGSPLIEIKRGMVVQKGQSELQALLNRGVKEFITSSEFGTIYARHFGRPATYWTTDRIALVMGMALVLMTFFMGAWRYYSTLQLNRRLTASAQEREHIAEELRKSERRFKDFADAASDWFWETDSDHRFTYISQSYFEITGFQPDERLGKTRQELVTTNDLKSESGKWTKFEEDLKARRPFKDLETSTSSSEGNGFYVLNSGIPVFDDNKKFLGYRGVSTNITQQKLAEEDRIRSERKMQQDHTENLETRIHERTEQLRGEIEERKRIEEDLIEASTRAESANQAKSEFLANMSHELRTPLNAIIGFSETLSQNIFGDLANDKQKEYIIDIHSSGIHLLDLINDILDVSAIEAGKLELHESDVDMKQIADEAILMVTPRAEKDGIKLQNLVAGNGLKLRADKRRLKQILVNLLSNAVKYTLEDTPVKITGGAGQNGGFIYKVEDSGVGMDEAEIATALEKFGQIQTTLGISREGTGLGLPLTHGLVEAHGGTLNLESKPGVGTTVTIEFPKERVVS
jgi:PAS domain S-box-containing protein